MGQCLRTYGTDQAYRRFNKLENMATTSRPTSSGGSSYNLKRKTDEPLWLHVVAGSGARGTCEAFMSPFHLVRVRQQHSTSSFVPLRSHFQQVVQADGVSALFKGLPSRLLWALPLSSFTFIYYEKAKGIFQNSRQKKSLSFSASDIKWAASGPLAISLGLMIRTPLDIVEARLQLSRTSNGRQAKGMSAIRNELKQIVESDGVKGLWRGYPSALLANLVFIGSYFIIYESSCAQLRKSPLTERYPAFVHLTAGGIAGGAAGFVTTPFDVIRTRLQTQATTTEGVSTTSGLEMWRLTWAEGGLRSLFRGLGPRLLSYSPAGAITFCAYELYKKMLLGK